MNEDKALRSLPADNRELMRDLPAGYCRTAAFGAILAARRN